MMLKCVLCRHIEETAFHLFLLRELDSCKSNMGVRRKTLFWMCSLSMQDDDYITIEFKNFKCGESSAQSFTVNGTVKLLYDVD